MMLTPEYFLIAFLFAALVFIIGVIVVYFQHREGQKRMAALHVRLGESIAMETSLRDQLLKSDMSKAILVNKIDTLIMRREDLLSCLQAAETDAQRVDCIHRLMET